MFIDGRIRIADMYKLLRIRTWDAQKHKHYTDKILNTFRTCTLTFIFLFYLKTYLDFFLPALPHAVTHIGLESEAQRHHRIPNAENKTKIILPGSSHHTYRVAFCIQFIFSAVNFLKFLVFKTPESGLDPYTYWIRIRIGIQPKMLDPDPYQMNADPQPWLKTIQINLINLTDTMCVVLYGTYYVCGRRRIYSRVGIQLLIELYSCRKRGRKREQDIC